MFLWMLLLINFMCVSVSASSVCMTVFVHGSYPALKLLAHSKSPVRHLIYAEPGLHLVKNLPEHYHFHKAAILCDQFDHDGFCKDHYYAYGWNSSNLRPVNRFEQGQKLYQAVRAQIENYLVQGYQNITVRFIGSSHGGNVVLNALQWLPFVKSNVDIEVILLGTPIQEETRNFINNSYVTRAYSFYSTSDWMQKIDIQKLHKNCPKNAPFFSQRTFLSTDKVVQVQLLVNSKPISHAQYRSVFGDVPKMIELANKHVGDKKIAHIVLDLKK
ncbi:hypothetical protein KBB68_00750 [Candidatus Babeliales bacterium]|nr:hypothetical protein [Candidatus Babeliales bacterium]